VRFLPPAREPQNPLPPPSDAPFRIDRPVLNSSTADRSRCIAPNAFTHQLLLAQPLAHSLAHRYTHRSHVTTFFSFACALFCKIGGYTPSASALSEPLLEVPPLTSIASISHARLAPVSRYRPHLLRASARIRAWLRASRSAAPSVSVVKRRKEAVLFGDLPVEAVVGIALGTPARARAASHLQMNAGCEGQAGPLSFPRPAPRLDFYQGLSWKVLSGRRVRCAMWQLVQVAATFPAAATAASMLPAAAASWISFATAWAFLAAVTASAVFFWVQYPSILANAACISAASFAAAPRSVFTDFCRFR